MRTCSEPWSAWSAARCSLPDRLAEIIGSSAKQQAAFNMCDGTMGQGEIAKALKLDSGNFSRTVTRWVDDLAQAALGVALEQRRQAPAPLPPAITDLETE